MSESTEWKLEEIPERGRKLEMDRLFEDWAGVVRKLKKLPSVFEYEQNSRYTEKPLSSRFGRWAQVPAALKMYAVQQGLAEEWRDVMELVEEQEKRAELERRSARSFFTGRLDAMPGGGPEGGPGGALAGEPGGEASLSAMVLAVTDESRPVYGVVGHTRTCMLRRMRAAWYACLALWHSSWDLWCCGYRRNFRIARRSDWLRRAGISG
jgi:hypothetical protein